MKSVVPIAVFSMHEIFVSDVTVMKLKVEKSFCVYH